MQFEIKGAPFPVVVMNLAGGETVKCQSGAMCWMSPNMKMETKSGGLGKMLGKAFTGESMFENNYTAQGGAGMIAFGSGVPGNILAVDVSPDFLQGVFSQAFWQDNISDYSSFFKK